MIVAAVHLTDVKIAFFAGAFEKNVFLQDGRSLMQHAVSDEIDKFLVGPRDGAIAQHEIDPTHDDRTQQYRQQNSIKAQPDGAHRGHFAIARQSSNH